MSQEELVSLLNFLRPTLSTRNLTDSIRLRMLITEWLLLNGLSTMHKFKKNLTSAEFDNGFLSTAQNSISQSIHNQHAEFRWQMPNKVDCASCGKYRVGRSKKFFILFKDILILLF